jgi:hypothetical protein
MTTTTLATALTGCAVGLYPLEADVALIIAEGTFLNRDDFTSRFIEHGTSDGTPMAAIDRDAASTALSNGELPCSAGERRVLAASASITAGIPVDLRDTPPASTHATSAGFSPPSATQPGNGPTQRETE